MSSLLANSRYAVKVNGSLTRSNSDGKLANPNQNPNHCLPRFIRVEFYLSHVLSIPSGENPDVAQCSSIQDISETSVFILSDESPDSLHVTREIEVEALSNMGVPESEHSWIIDSIAHETSGIIASARVRNPPPPGFALIPVSAMSISVQIRQIFQFESLENMLSAIMEDVSSPEIDLSASKSLIGMLLQRGRHSRSDDATCTICLDDFAHDQE